jgi:hypothetical protein
MADLTTEQHDSIRAAVRQILMPLIEGVLIQKLAQVAVVIRDELERNAGVQPAEPLSSELATAARRFLTRWQEMSESELHRAADALEATLGVQEPRAVTPQEDAVLRRAAMRSAKVVSAGVAGKDGETFPPTHADEALLNVNPARSQKDGYRAAPAASKDHSTTLPPADADGKE